MRSHRSKAIRHRQLPTYPSMDESSRQWLNRLHLAEIIALLDGRIVITSAERRTKKKLIEKLLSTASATDLVLSLCQHAQQKVNDGDPKERPKKHRHHDPTAAGEGEDVESYDSSKYLDLPSSREVRVAYKAFYQATSSSCVQRAVCGICARKCGPLDDQLMTHSLKALPNSHRLAPSKPHPLHDLYEGKLLEPTGVIGDAGDYKVNVCSTCLDDLLKKKDVPPWFALANNLWIGQVPWQIQVLTFPEQLLVSLVYPRVFVFKLFPKKVGGIRDLSLLQRAMRGKMLLHMRWTPKEWLTWLRGDCCLSIPRS